MKKILLLVLSVLLVAPVVRADTCATSLMPAFTSAQATAICTKFGSSVASSLIPQADNTIDLGSATKTWRTLYTGTSRITKTSDILRVEQDPQRLFTWDGSSDTALTETFGDGGTTAVQKLTISASTADTDDDSTLILAGGGALATDGTRGAYITLAGEEVSGGGDIIYNAGASDTHQFQTAGTETMNIGTGGLVTSAGGFTATLGDFKATTAAGLVAGEASRAANVTTVTTLAVPVYVSAAASGTDLAAFIGSGANASGPVFDFLKTRATSGAATTIVAANDALGTIKFWGANGTTYDPAITIVGTVSGTPGASADMGGKLVFNLSPDGSATPAAVLTLDQDKSALFTGTLRSSATTTIGWSVVAAPNQACNTTCTSACVTGIDTLGTGGFLDCATATSDFCLCAGSS